MASSHHRASSDEFASSGEAGSSIACDVSNSNSSSGSKSRPISSTGESASGSSLRFARRDFAVPASKTKGSTQTTVEDGGNCLVESLCAGKNDVRVDIPTCNRRSQSDSLRVKELSWCG